MSIPTASPIPNEDNYSCYLLQIQNLKKHNLKQQRYLHKMYFVQTGNFRSSLIYTIVVAIMITTISDIISNDNITDI